MTLNYHETDMPWRKVLEKAVEMDYRSHQTSTCGLHIHVNRSTLSEDATVQLVHEICTQAIKKSDKEFENMSCSDSITIAENQLKT